jgi:hypothetical protein
MWKYFFGSSFFIFQWRKTKMAVRPIDMADLSLVEFVLNIGYPNCKLHGAMNKVTKDGIWRCISTYTKTSDNGCRAGCWLGLCREYPEWKRHSKSG